jgi:hypothetical protein
MSIARIGLRIYAFCVPLILQVRQMLIACANSLVPAALPLYEMTTGVAQTQILASFVGLGIPQALSSGPKTLAELSHAVGSPPEVLQRFLQTSQALGLLQHSSDKCYRPTARTRALHPDTPHGMAAFARYMASKSNVDAWGQLTGVVQTGQDAFNRAYGASVWSHLAANPEEEATFAQAMAALAHMDGPAIARAYPFARHDVICDVGGGRGALLKAVLHEYPSTRGLVVDQASVTGPAAAALEPAWRQRLQFVAGNFFEMVPAGCDAYMLRHVLHDWDDAACRLILDRCREVMGPDTRLLIVDSRVEPQDTAFLGAIKDLTMAVVCGGRERGTAAMRDLLAASDMRLVRIWPTASPVVIWEAARRMAG